MKTLKWQVQSPDINPIGNLWVQMKYKVEKQRSKINKAESMKVLLAQLWEDISIESMFERAYNVTKNKGKSTR